MCFRVPEVVVVIVVRGSASLVLEVKLIPDAYPGEGYIGEVEFLVVKLDFSFKSSVMESVIESCLGFI